MSRPRLLDLFCGAGGASAGYERAGFDVTGVDVEPQKHYPFRFEWADAMTLTPAFLATFDAVHASPPCQAYSSLRHLQSDVRRGAYPELIERTRSLLRASGRPYVIENVMTAPLEDYIVLCGTSFGHPLLRHRKFESNLLLIGMAHAHELHKRELPGLHRSQQTRAGLGSRYVGVYGGTRSAGDGRWARQAMGIDWMTRKELTQAIPPYYAEYVGAFLLRSLSEWPLV